MRMVFTIFVFEAAFVVATGVVATAVTPVSAAVEIVEAEGLAERGRSEIKT